MKIKLTALFLTLLLFLTACADAGQDASSHTQEGSDLQTTADGQSAEKTGENTEDIYVRPTAPQGKPSDSETGVGAPLEQLGIDRGYFSGESKDVDLECLMGTKGAYKLEGNTLTFTAIGEETIYAISGNSVAISSSTLAMRISSSLNSAVFPSSRTRKARSPCSAVKRLR